MSQLTDAQLITEATVIKTETALGANTADRVGTMFIDSINSKINIDVIDANTALGTSDSKIPSQNAVKTYADGLVVGLVDDRGNFTPSATSPGGYPTTGGSGTSGAIKKGDLWFIDTVGYLSTTPVVVGTSVRALTDSPGQTAANWNILNVGLGFTPENVLNKSTNVALGTSDTLYPSQNAVKSYVDNNTVSKTAPNTISGINTFTGSTIFESSIDISASLSVNYSLDLGIDVPITSEGDPGTLGQVLTSQGGAATPTWETPTPGISPADNTTFTGDITFNQNTEFTAGITTPLASTSVINGTLDLNYIVRANGSAGTAGQVLTSNGAAVPTWGDISTPEVLVEKLFLSSLAILNFDTLDLVAVPAPPAGKAIYVTNIAVRTTAGQGYYTSPDISLRPDGETNAVVQTQNMPLSVGNYLSSNNVFTSWSNPTSVALIFRGSQGVPPAGGTCGAYVDITYSLISI